MGSLDSIDIVSARLKGKELHVPNLQDIFAHWPSRLSPHQAELTEVINRKLDEWIKDPKTRLKADKCDIPVFTSRWWPSASVDAALCAAFYNLWLFIWDDALDGEDAMHDMASTRELHRQAIAFIEHKLGLAAAGCGQPTAPSPVAPSEATAVVFDFIGERLCAGHSEAGRRRFFREIEYYMRCCEVEQRHYYEGVLPSVEEYWAQRRGTTSVYSSAALADFLAGVQLPEELFQTRELEALWDEHNNNISIVNDILSLKKEVVSDIPSDILPHEDTAHTKSHHQHVGAHSNIIPITMQETGKDLDAIVQDLVEQVRESVARFDRAAAGLLAMVAGDAGMHENVEGYIEVLQTNLTGNYYWSLGCARYGITKYIQKDGSLIIPL